MTIHQNAYFIGERVEWYGAEGRSAGAGVVCGLYVAECLIYRVERDELHVSPDRKWSNRYELLEEREIRREGMGG